MILYYFIILSFLYFYKYQNFYRFNLKKKFIVLIIIIIPIILQYAFVLGKTVGITKLQRIIDKTDFVYKAKINPH